MRLRRIVMRIRERMFPARMIMSIGTMKWQIHSAVFHSIPAYLPPHPLKFPTARLHITSVRVTSIILRNAINQAIMNIPTTVIIQTIFPLPPTTTIFQTTPLLPLPATTTAQTILLLVLPAIARIQAIIILQRTPPQRNTTERTAIDTTTERNDTQILLISIRNIRTNQAATYGHSRIITRNPPKLIQVLLPQDMFLTGEETFTRNFKSDLHSSSQSLFNTE
mmetsp:Transcript_20700/g.30559  ORF Transcript_20700/g.30559 Transcript_20700/m.30559 type:complete len:222 (-) Transcript_20700:146-811(-)